MQLEVKVFGALVVFYTEDSKLRYWTGQLGPVSSGSCAYGIELDRECLDWKGPFDVPLIGPSVSAFDAEPWGGGIAVAWRGPELGGSASPNVLQVTQATSGLATGELAGWSLPVSIGLSADSPELSVINVDATVHGKSQLLMATWQSVPSPFLNPDAATAAEYVTTDWTVLGPNAWSSPSDVLDSQGAPIVVRRRPNLAAWPGRDVPVGFSGDAGACGVFPDAGSGSTFSRLQAYCLDPSSSDLRWNLASAQFWSTSGLSTSGTTEAPDLVYRPSRLPDGSLEAGQVGLGEFWLSYVSQSDGIERVYMSGPARDTTPPESAWFDGFTRRTLARDIWLTPFDGGNVALYDDETLGGMFAAHMDEAVNPGTGLLEGRIRFYKAADGAVDHDMMTGNDYQVMERRICTVLRGSGPLSLCGDQSTSIHGY